jgi:type I restriction enzyme S subunit
VSDAGTWVRAGRLRLGLSQADVARRVGTTRVLVEGIAGVHQEIALLREYRTRLIADVVTGKLDVREAAARLPDEVDEVGAEGLDEIEDSTEGEDTSVEDAVPDSEEIA